MNDTLTWIGLIIGILGLIGLPFAILTYISPRYRMKRYLNKPTKWMRVDLDLNGSEWQWQYKPHPEYTIVQLDDEEWDRTVTEKWMKYPLPDPSKWTHMIHVKAGDIVIHTVRFISLDGGRYLVPLPEVKYHEKKEDNEYFYTPIQIQISKIIGTYYRMSSIDEFIKLNEIEVRHKDKRIPKIVSNIWHMLVG